MTEILVLGSANIDLVVRVARLPRPGETVMGSRMLVHEGGKGANQAVAAARAGATVSFICALGTDANGERLQAALAKAAVHVDPVLVPDEGTGTAVIHVDDTGQNTICVIPGANGCLTPEHVHRAEGAFSRARMLLLQLEVPLDTVEAAARTGRRHGLQVILNPAPARGLPPALLEQVDVLTPNEVEAELLTGWPVEGVEGATAAAERLLQRGPEIVVRTLGGAGAYLATRDGLRTFVPAFEASVVDTTAAGDVFNGALAVALSEGLRLEEATRFACAAAALSVERAGAQPSAPRREEIDRAAAERPQRRP